MVLRQTSLSANIVQFCRYLRQHNFTIGAGEQLLALRALEHIDYSSQVVFARALQAVLCRSQQQVKEFDNLFNAYWKELEKGVDSKQKKAEKPEARPITTNAESFKALKAWLHGNRRSETENMASYSQYESLSHKDFSHVPADEIAELMQNIKALAKRMAAKANRRYQAAHQGSLPDLRRTLRANMRRGGELLHLAWKNRKPNRNKLVVLCDVSQSMELYSAFLLQFMYAFQQAFARTRTFVFGTMLQETTTILKGQSFAAAMQSLSIENVGWKGGTRIGDCLMQFVEGPGRHYIDKKTVVVILSDGWDQGDPSGIAQSMGWLKNHSRRIIWLNPLAGKPGYKPQTAGMQAALPFVQVLAPAHNAQSLRKLAWYL